KEDQLGRDHVGWDPNMDDEALFRANRGCWVLAPPLPPGAPPPAGAPHLSPGGALLTAADLPDIALLRRVRDALEARL
ncbi:hypothetical protein AB0F34_26885, partial [Streptomyces fradiae]